MLPKIVILGSKIPSTAAGRRGVIVRNAPLATVGPNKAACRDASRRHQLGQRASIGSFRGEHVVGRQRAPDPFECKLTNRFYRDRIFDRREDTGTD